jgi:hypothetical protein
MSSAAADLGYRTLANRANAGTYHPAASVPGAEAEVDRPYLHRIKRPAGVCGKVGDLVGEVGGHGVGRQPVQVSLEKRGKCTHIEVAGSAHATLVDDQLAPRGEQAYCVAADRHGQVVKADSRWSPTAYHPDRMLAAYLKGLLAGPVQPGQAG